MQPKRYVLGQMTEEDLCIWSRIYFRSGWRPEWGTGPAARADRRDANLMHMLAQIPPNGFTEMPRARSRAWLLCCFGAEPVARAFNIRYCA
jgi:hypothetical protein